MKSRRRKAIEAAGHGSATPAAGVARPGKKPFLSPLAGLGLILAAALVHQLPAASTPFFADDYLFLDQVAHGSLVEVLTAPDPIGNFFRPVGRQLYFWVVARVGGGSAGFSHGLNLALWLGVVALLFAVARVLSGPRAGLIAAAFVALHYVADVPVRWASGSQELLAVVGALGALWLHLRGHRIWAAPVLLLALLSKEVVALTPLIAVVAAREQGETWRAAARRAWPLGAAVAVWAFMLWLALQSRPGAGAQLTATPAMALAALAHMAQAAFAIEWGPLSEARAESLVPGLLPVAAVVLMALAATGTGEAPASPAPRRGRPALPRGIRSGAAWALLAAAPVAVVAPIWSAYYYLFAVCGVALVFGAWLGPRPRVWGMIVAALVAWSSARVGALPMLAMVSNPWTTCSHVNRHYIERGTRTISRYLRHLRAARTSLPPSSTVFFSGVPGSVAFQTADGPLVRWAYRDTSLRSYYLNSFDLEKARRGPLFFFEVRDDSLCETTSDPGLFTRIALGAILSQKPQSARDMLEVELVRRPASALTVRYWTAWIDWDLGQRERAIAGLKAAGFQARPGPVPQFDAATAAIRARDTLGAVRLIQRGVEAYALDAPSHGLLSDLALALGRASAVGVIEAYAARLLEPAEPLHWRRWALVQIEHLRVLESARSLRKYFDMVGAEAEHDAEAQRLAYYLRTKYPVAAQALAGGGPKP